MKEFMSGKGGTVLTLLGGLLAIWLTAILGKYLPDDMKTMLLAGEASLVAFVLAVMKSLISPNPTTSSTTTTTKTSAPTPEDDTK